MDISIDNRKLAAMNCLNTVEVAATCRFSIAQMFGATFGHCFDDAETACWQQYLAIFCRTLQQSQSSVSMLAHVRDAQVWSIFF